MLSCDKILLEKAVENYSDSLMRLAFTYTKSIEDAKDLVQDVFLKYMTHSPEFQSPEHEKAWLMRVAINICKNHLTSAYRKSYAELDESISVSDSYSSGLLEAVKSLPYKYRAVIHLYYYEGYSQKEIAKITRITESGVATRLQRGRNLLRERLGDDFFE